MKTVNLVMKFVLGLCAVALLAGVWVSPAAAQEPTTTPAREYVRLEYALKRLTIRADVQQDLIEGARQYADLTEEFIEDQQTAGRDTSALEAALSTFRAEIDQAQALNAEANQVLDEKAGFDADGKVVDRAQAADTIESAKRALQDARQTLAIAAQDFRQAVRDYRQDQRPN